MSSNHESSSSGASFSSFFKESRAKLDAASEKGRNYMNKDHGSSSSSGGGGGGGHFSSFTNKITGSSEPAPTIEARPLSALKDPKSFPAPPLHRAVHGDPLRPAAHYPPTATAQPPVAAAASAPAYTYPQPTAYPPPAAPAAYPPPAGYPQPGYPQPAYQQQQQQQPPPTAPAPLVYQPPVTGYQPPTAVYQPPVAGYQPSAAGYQPPVAGYQPPVAAYQPPVAAYQPPVATPAAYPPPPAAAPVAAPVAVSPPPVAAPYQPPPPPGLPGYQPPGGVPATPARAPPQLPSRQNSIAYRASVSSPSPAEPEPKPHVPLPDPSSFPAPPPLYQGPTGAPEPVSHNGRRASHYTSSTTAKHSAVSPATHVPAPAPLPSASSFPPPPGTQPYQPHLARTVPPPPTSSSSSAPAPAPVATPSHTSIGYSPSIKKKPPPVPTKLNKKSPPVPPGRSSNGAPQAPPSRAATFEESPPPPYTEPRPKSPSESENTNHFHRTFAARDPGLSQEAQSYQSSSSDAPMGPIAGGTASQIAKQFEKMHILAPQRRPSDHLQTPGSTSTHAAPATTHTTPSAAAIAAHHKKAPPKPPKKPSFSHEHHLAPEPAAPVPAAAPAPASTSNAPPPPINYSTRPDPGSLTPSTSHSSTNSASFGANKKDPKDQFDLDLPSLWFTKPARTLTLPASLQGINYTFSLSSSSGSSRKLILALRIAETLAIVKFKLEWKVEDPLGTVTVERKDIPPPEPMAQAQLAQAHDAFGESIARYAESVVGTQVGDGECWTLAQQAITQAAAGAAMVPQGYTHGALVYHAVGGAPAPLCYADRIARGDICQFTSGRFDTRNAAGVIVGQAYVGAPNHTSIVVHVSDDNRTIDVLQQNVGGVRRVQAGKHNLDELVAGEVKIYRPVWKEWAGELEAKWD
ncbi:uncharacterized protein SAPINGB_P003515 [Magnusiomyces paraingens]|uniref:BBC1/AIM3 cysteine proteinase-fold domain-containing protein n=1 Tax=Magnusiomyces paraingens TaxID=2606893 RepID=A0A5E8BPQ9_9ASCO|nr:uncharacterized protein SAPINGB_P003515 [Saprochaete ingens]VVT53323.1 unnamed protein product [Saprochaete ingens]